MASEIESLLEYALNIGASELIVTEGAPSAVRFAGRVCAVPESSALPFGSWALSMANRERLSVGLG